MSTELYANCLKGLGTFKARWLEALRSGRYQQAQRVLRSPTNAYCCLGIACDLIDPEGWDTELAQEQLGVKGFKWRGLLPWMTDENLSIALRLSQDKVHKLASMNDGGTNFDRIADWIEANI